LSNRPLIIRTLLSTAKKGVGVKGGQNGVADGQIDSPDLAKFEALFTCDNRATSWKSKASPSPSPPKTWPQNLFIWPDNFLAFEKERIQCGWPNLLGAVKHGLQIGTP